MFQAICESGSTESILTSVLADVKVALVNCTKNDTIVMLLGGAQTADIMDICTYGQSCPNVSPKKYLVVVFKIFYTTYIHVA